MTNTSQVSMSPATAATTRRDGEGGGYCRKWTTAAWRNWRVKDPRTALLQVRQRQDERKRTSVLSLPPSIFPFLPTSRTVREMKKKKWNKWSPHMFCLSTPPPPRFHCLMWGNPDCEVRWFPMSSGYSRRWHSGCLSGFHCGSLSRVSRILQVQSSLSPSYPALNSLFIAPVPFLCVSLMFFPHCG